MLRSTFRNVRLNAQPAQQRARVVTIITAIGIQFVGMFFRSPRLSFDFRKVDYHRNDLPVIADVRSGRNRADDCH